MSAINARAIESLAGPVVLRLERVASPIGDLLLYSTPEAVCALDFVDLAGAIERCLRRRYGAFTTSSLFGSDAARRVGAYLKGDIGAIDAIAIDPGGTPFQRDVWQAMREVPAATTRTYAWLAGRIGRQLAVRAVGGASSRNPIALIVPCHRIVGANGSLVGYAGGVARKHWLLSHERSATSTPRRGHICHRTSTPSGRP